GGPVRRAPSHRRALRSALRSLVSISDGDSKGHPVHELLSNSIALGSSLRANSGLDHRVGVARALEARLALEEALDAGSGDGSAGVPVAVLSGEGHAGPGAPDRADAREGAEASRDDGFRFSVLRGGRKRRLCDRDVFAISGVDLGYLPARVA